MSYVLAFLGFVALIILHEAGHFTAAKAVGMRVERFSLFMGPLLVKFRRGETEYGIGPFPLGGYVRITGMNPHEELSEERELNELTAQRDGLHDDARRILGPGSGSCPGAERGGARAHGQDLGTPDAKSMRFAGAPITTRRSGSGSW